MSILPPPCAPPLPATAPPAATVRRCRPRWRERWDAPVRDFPIRDEILLQFLPLRRDMAVLELGPGCGYTAYWLAPQLRRLALVDVAAPVIADLRAALGARGPLEYAVWDISQPGLEGRLRGGFDAAFALDAFQYVADPAAALRNFRGLLGPGGELLLSFPNSPPEEGDAVICFRRRQDLAALLRQAGFARWRISTIRLRPGPRALYRAGHEWPFAILRTLRGGAEKPRAYDHTWAFRARHRVARFRPALHLYWMALDRLLAAFGPVFAVPGSAAPEPILRQRVLVEAWK